MQLLRSFLSNHVFANLTFAVVMVMGIGGYILRGASAEDVEKLVTQPLEDAIRKVSDVKFVSSSSREGVSSILVRFEDIAPRTFDKRINDLRREIQNKTNQELPPEVDDPTVLEITTSNGFPTAMVLVLGQSDDEVLRATARQIRDDLERISGVDDVLAAGLHDPELVVDFDPAALEAHNLTATQLSDAVTSWFRDVFGGRIRIGEKEWLVRMVGKDADPDILAAIPVTAGANRGHIPLSSIAKVSRLREKPSQLASQNGRQGILLSITKKGYTNTLDLVSRINEYVDQRNEALAALGLELALVDDQTVPTREAIRVMQTNAALGLLLVLVTTWAFLGSRIAVLLSLGIPFSLAGAFAVIYAIRRCRGCG
jgi:multidrug efflux pump subunit AcrB